MIKFKDDFLFGSAISAPQSEGRLDNDYKSKDIWDYWYEIEPYKFFNEVGPEKTSTIIRNYHDDVKLLKETGHNSYRTSISWSRLMKDGVSINKEAIKYYRDYFTCIKNEGIKLFVNLFHFDMPYALQVKDGWNNKEVVDLYAEYAKACFENFSDLVDYWITFNEPIVHVECGYLLQYHYPMEVNPKKAVQVGFNTALASAKAIKNFKEINKDGKIGIVLNLTPAYPRSNNEKDVKAAEIAELFANKSFLDPAIKGEYPKLLIDLVKKHDLMPVYTKEELEIIKNNTVDFLGVNYYQPLRVCARSSMPNEEAPFFPTYYYDVYTMPGRRVNPHRGWEIYPKGIYDLSINIRDNYGNIPWYIAENGMGVENEERFIVDGVIQDDYRIEFYKEHLTYLSKAIDEGANCFGYHVWTFIDCWSWLNAYKNRYGLVALDLKTQKRTIKKSGRWFKELSDNKGF